MNKENRLLTYADVADQYNIKVATLYALVSQERIPHIRVGPRFVRFDQAELERWLAAKAIMPKDGSE